MQDKTGCNIMMIMIIARLSTHHVGAGVGSLVGLLVGAGVGAVGARVRFFMVGAYV